ncbi:MAG: fasciclin domain-containing protein [Actinomycetota bacterium]|nr:fasciclin domain-containing protein [Actinomycetota bacterium]
MKSRKVMKGMFALAAISMVAAACGDDKEATTTTVAPAESTMDTMAPDTTMGEMMNSAEICSADDLVAAVQGGDSEGTLEGMTDDPVATAASNNPVLTTLVTAVSAAGLVDTLNGAEALTVFAPTDCAFAALDPATLEAALADPTGLLTTVLGFHVIPERLSSEELAGMTEVTTFTGEVLSLEAMGGSLSLAGGQATVVIPDIQTANATVHLIDNVLLPPSVTGEEMEEEAMTSAEICDADAIVAAVEGGDEEGTLAGMTDDPVATAASNNPILTTLVTAVSAAGLVDTLNGAEALTVFAPTDCAFAALDPATLEAALADPSGLLTTVLGYHVIPERLSAADLADMTELTTFTGEILPIMVDGDVITVNGTTMVVVGEIQTANATVYLVDSVMLPPSVTG